MARVRDLRLTSLTLFAALLLVAGLIWVVDDPGVRAQDRASAQPPHGPPTLSREVEARYRVFRARGGSDPTPAEAMRLRRGAAGPQQQDVIDSTTIRVANTDAAGRVTVGAGSNDVCLGVRENVGSGSLSCTTGEVAVDPARPMVAVDELGNGRQRITGLMQDGVRSLVLITADDKVHRLALINNTFTAIVTQPSAALRWESSDGVRREQTLLASVDRAVAP